ncbi:hypothetical protein CAOG_04655 [Capsaspora owczarzaki ATCC 30864]|uniref:Putative zinc-finger domain-containing protein n=1 Tax=Capsaspora owczarzaki (strain ATCC 30864) TaxID=595528 RepID=A0A0D2WQI2_CAPO3|nr:hypothetical protein CAOG_04655 [Capsaspora owczarzaki ATCC 30864]KJE93945.1 hypothetical protein CAOG_004655 [Capsaspora owczarzaki ATCC 30864]|eukprot:XP_004347402.1 hypothetical protein CAOG_04655 [Capsaspora owczarzaki ATCC 30864]
MSSYNERSRELDRFSAHRYHSDEDPDSFDALIRRRESGIVEKPQPAEGPKHALKAPRSGGPGAVRPNPSSSRGKHHSSGSMYTSSSSSSSAAASSSTGSYTQHSRHDPRFQDGRRAPSSSSDHKAWQPQAQPAQQQDRYYHPSEVAAQGQGQGQGQGQDQAQPHARLPLIEYYAPEPQASSNPYYQGMSAQLQGQQSYQNLPYEHGYAQPPPSWSEETFIPLPFLSVASSATAQAPDEQAAALLQFPMSQAQQQPQQDWQRYHDGTDQLSAAANGAPQLFSAPYSEPHPSDVQSELQRLDELEAQLATRRQQLRLQALQQPLASQSQHEPHPTLVASQQLQQQHQLQQPQQHQHQQHQLQQQQQQHQPFAAVQHLSQPQHNQQLFALQEQTTVAQQPYASHHPLQNQQHQGFTSFREPFLQYSDLHPSQPFGHASREPSRSASPLPTFVVQPSDQSSALSTAEAPKPIKHAKRPLAHSFFEQDLSAVAAATPVQASTTNRRPLLSFARRSPFQPGLPSERMDDAMELDSDRDQSDASSLSAADRMRMLRQRALEAKRALKTTREQRVTSPHELPVVEVPPVSVLPKNQSSSGGPTIASSSGQETIPVPANLVADAALHQLTSREPTPVPGKPTQDNLVLVLSDSDDESSSSDEATDSYQRFAVDHGRKRMEVFKANMARAAQSSPQPFSGSAFVSQPAVAPSSSQPPFVVSSTRTHQPGALSQQGPAGLLKRVTTANVLARTDSGLQQAATSDLVTSLPLEKQAEYMRLKEILAKRQTSSPVTPLASGTLLASTEPPATVTVSALPRAPSLAPSVPATTKNTSSQIAVSPATNLAVNVAQPSLPAGAPAVASGASSSAQSTADEVISTLAHQVSQSETKVKVLRAHIADERTRLNTTVAQRDDAAEVCIRQEQRMAELKRELLSLDKTLVASHQTRRNLDKAVAEAEQELVKKESELTAIERQIADSRRQLKLFEASRQRMLHEKTSTIEQQIRTLRRHVEVQEQKQLQQQQQQQQQQQREQLQQQLQPEQDSLKDPLNSEPLQAAEGDAEEADQAAADQQEQADQADLQPTPMSIESRQTLVENGRPIASFPSSTVQPQISNSLQEEQPASADFWLVVAPPRASQSSSSSALSANVGAILDTAELHKRQRLLKTFAGVVRSYGLRFDRLAISASFAAIANAVLPSTVDVVCDNSATAVVGSNVDATSDTSQAPHAKPMAQEPQPQIRKTRAVADTALLKRGMQQRCILLDAFSAVVQSNPSDATRAANLQHSNATKRPRVYEPYESPLLQFRSYRLSPFYRTQAHRTLTSLTHSSNLDMMRPLCHFDLLGTCNDEKCAFQHLRSLKQDDEAIYQNLAAYAIKESLDSVDKNRNVLLARGVPPPAFSTRTDQKVALQLRAHLLERRAEFASNGVSLEDASLMLIMAVNQHNKRRGFGPPSVVSPMTIRAGVPNVNAPDDEQSDSKHTSAKTGNTLTSSTSTSSTSTGSTSAASSSGVLDLGRVAEAISPRRPLLSLQALDEQGQASQPGDPSAISSSWAGSEISTKSTVRYHQPGAAQSRQDLEQQLDADPHNEDAWLALACQLMEPFPSANPANIAPDAARLPVPNYQAALSALSTALESQQASSTLWTVYLDLFHRQAVLAGTQKDGAHVDEMREMYATAVTLVPQPFPLFWHWLDFESTRAGKSSVLLAIVKHCVEALTSFSSIGNRASATPALASAYRVWLLDSLLSIVQLFVLAGNLAQACQVLEACLALELQTRADWVDPDLFIRATELVGVGCKSVLWLSYLHLLAHHTLPVNLFDMRDCGLGRLVMDARTITIAWDSSVRLSPSLSSAQAAPPVSPVSIAPVSVTQLAQLFGQAQAQLFAQNPIPPSNRDAPFACALESFIINQVRFNAAFISAQSAIQTAEDYVSMGWLAVDLRCLCASIHASDQVSGSQLLCEMAASTVVNEAHSAMALWYRAARFQLDGNGTAASRQIALNCLIRGALQPFDLSGIFDGQFSSLARSVDGIDAQPSRALMLLAFALLSQLARRPLPYHFVVPPLLVPDLRMDGFAITHLSLALFLQLCVACRNVSPNAPPLATSSEEEAADASLADTEAHLLRAFENEYHPCLPFTDDARQQLTNELLGVFERGLLACALSRRDTMQLWSDFVSTMASEVSAIVTAEGMASNEAKQAMRRLTLLIHRCTASAESSRPKYWRNGQFSMCRTEDAVLFAERVASGAEDPITTQQSQLDALELIPALLPSSAAGDEFLHQSSKHLTHNVLLALRLAAKSPQQFRLTRFLLASPQCEALWNAATALSRVAASPDSPATKQLAATLAVLLYSVRALPLHANRWKHLAAFLSIHSAQLTADGVLHPKGSVPSAPAASPTEAIIQANQSILVSQHALVNMAQQFGVELAGIIEVARAINKI